MTALALFGGNPKFQLYQFTMDLTRQMQSQPYLLSFFKTMLTDDSLSPISKISRNSTPIFLVQIMLFAIIFKVAFFKKQSKAFSMSGNDLFNNIN